MYTIHPNNPECFFLRILLHNVRGPTSFENLRSVNDIVYETYREACLQLGLLKDDKHWDDVSSEASDTKRSSQIRSLFTIIFTQCVTSNPQ